MEFAQWLEIVAIASLSLAGACALVIILDIMAGHRQHMWIMWFNFGMRLPLPCSGWRWSWAMLCWLIPLAHCGAGTNELRSWDEYRTIMWIGDSAYKQPERVALFFQRLREMGINTAMVYGDASPQPLLTNQFPYYVENIVNRGLCLKFNSKVRDWDKFVTDWSKNGRPESALVRDYCLDDPTWGDWACKQMREVAGHNRLNQPLAYDIRDELSTTFSANPFDYDFGPTALAGFRDWLKAQYAGLAELNREWETEFKSWDEVRPFTTDEIKNRMASGLAQPGGKPDWQALQRLKFVPEQAAREPTRWNFAPWADFRTYMDASLARALESLRQAAHEVDPRTPVGIEGTQMPNAFGGYDLWRLSQVLDWVEPYDIGNAREIFGSFMPGRPLITTVFEKETKAARRRLWHLLLEGDRGCIVWWSEDCIDWARPDYPLTAKAQALAPVLKEMTSPLARLFLRAEPVRDPVFIQYSQPSIQVDWLLESTVDGSTWLRRFSSFEAEHNRQAKVRDGWVKAVQDLGYSPRFISSEQILRGELEKSSNAVLILPGSYALGAGEVQGIKRFLGAQRPGSFSGAAALGDGRAPGRVVLWDGAAGWFDEHGRLRKAPLPPFNASGAEGQCVGLEANGAITVLKGEPALYPAHRLKGDADPEWRVGLQSLMKGVTREVSLPAEARVRIHRYRVPRGALVAFERNIDYHMSEDLKQAGGNERLETPVPVEAQLQGLFHVYELRTEKYLGYTNRLHFTLDPWQPALFGLSAEKLGAGHVVEELGDGGGS